MRHPGISVDDYRLLQEMQRRGLLTMRVNALLRPGGDPAAVLAALDASGLHDGDGDAWLRVGGVKLAVDGGFEGGLMREPYDEPWGEGGAFKGLQIMTRPAFEQVVSGLNDRGWRVATHAVGDAAIDLVLDTYEQANARKPITGRRWSIEHAFIGRPDHLPRIKALGLGARRPEPSVSGRSEPGGLLGRRRARPSRRRCAPISMPDCRCRRAPTRRSCRIRRCGRSTTSSPATRSPAACSAPISGSRRAEALRMATMGNAWLTMEERDKGSLEAGKLADLVVLSDDPLTCPEPRLRDAQVLMTIVGGRVVHDQLK